MRLTASPAGWLTGLATCAAGLLAGCSGSASISRNPVFGTRVEVLTWDASENIPAPR
jgi:hypothetical protein